jgi:hypothetical protein
MITKVKERAGDMIEHLPSMLEALGSISSAERGRDRDREGEEEGGRR